MTYVCLQTERWNTYLSISTLPPPLIKGGPMVVNAPTCPGKACMCVEIVPWMSHNEGQRNLNAGSGRHGRKHTSK